MGKRQRVLEAAGSSKEDENQNETQDIPRFSDDQVAKRVSSLFNPV